MNIWPFQKSKTVKMWKPTVTFVGEQDGLAEKTLKKKLTEVFISKAGIRQAYLARVTYNAEDNDSSVALCLLADEDRKLVEDVSQVFREYFRKDCFLDILFISTQRKPELDSVCHPFYSREDNDEL